MARAFGKRWHLLPPPPSAFTRRFRHLPYLWARLLYHRGVRTPQEAEAWLNPTEALLGDPFLLPDMDRAVERLKRAIVQRETIAVFGDFDADGVTGCALLTRALQDMGAQVIPYIPHRVAEGHGLNVEALTDLARRGASLLVTVDCGVSSPEEVALGRELGLEVIITDHHTTPPTLPEAVAVVDPCLPDARYPWPSLAGVGLAFKLVQALCHHLGQSWPVNLLQLVAIGTVADVAPLTGENRYLVQRGLQGLRTAPLPALQALMEAAGVSASGVDTETIGYVIAPRINAAGRVDHAAHALRLLLAPDVEAATPLAQGLEGLNRQRQEMTASVLAQVQPQAQEQSHRPILFLTGDDLPPGVIGLVASKLVEEFYRPAVVVSRGPERSRASCRSIPEFNMVQALAQCKELFHRFGGHPQAAGFEIPSARLWELERQLLALAEEQLAEVPLAPRLDVDAEVPLGVLTGDVLRFLHSLSPFGAGNPSPVLLSRDIQVVDARPVGGAGDHLILKLRQGEAVWDAVAFDQGHRWAPDTQRVDVVYTVGSDRWQGRDTPRLVVLDWRPSRRGRPASGPG